MATNSNNFVISHQVYSTLKSNADGSVRVTKSSISCWRNLDRGTPHLRVLDAGVGAVAGRQLMSAWDLLVPTSRVEAAETLATEFIANLATLERADAGKAFKNLSLQIQKLWVEHEEEAKKLAESRKQVKGIPEVIFGVEEAAPIVKPEPKAVADDELPF